MRSVMILRGHSSNTVASVQDRLLISYYLDLSKAEIFLLPARRRPRWLLEMDYVPKRGNLTSSHDLLAWSTPLEQT
jgi:hypothetical protein